jgi:hypothetical protein
MCLGATSEATGMGRLGQVGGSIAPSDGRPCGVIAGNEWKAGAIGLRTWLSQHRGSGALQVQRDAATRRQRRLDLRMPPNGWPLQRERERGEAVG